MQSFLVVHLIDKRFDSSSGFFQIAILTTMHFFVLQGFHEALGISIVVWIPPPTHADGDISLAQSLRMPLRGILHATIGVMHHTRAQTTMAKRVLWSIDWQPGLQPAPPSAPNHTPRVAIHHH